MTHSPTCCCDECTDWEAKTRKQRSPDEYVLPEPNEFVWALRDLTFGKREYKDSERKTKNWRELVQDKYADMPIASDIDRIGTFLPFDEIFDAYKIEEMLVRHPTVIKQVHNLYHCNFKSLEFRPLKISIGEIFRAHYKPVFMEQWQASDRGGKYSADNPPDACRIRDIPYSEFRLDPERQWKQACKQFDLANNLIAHFLCRHYTLYREQWRPLLAEHADYSQYYKHFTMKALVARPEMIE